MISFVGIDCALASSNVSSLACSIPSGSVGDLLVFYAANSNPNTWQTPSGWTTVESLTTTKTNTVGVSCWFKTATSGDTSVTAKWSSGTSCTIAAACLRYSGVDTSIPPTGTGRHGFTTTGSSSSVEFTTSSAPPALSAMHSYDTIIDCWCIGQANATGSTTHSPTPGFLQLPGAPAGWTQRGNNTTGDALSTGPTRGTKSSSPFIWNCGMVIADKLGATDTPTVTSTDSTGNTGTNNGATGNWVVMSMALTPLVIPTPNQFMSFFGM